MRKLIANACEVVGLGVITTVLWMVHVYVGLGFIGLVMVVAGNVLDRSDS